MSPVRSAPSEGTEGYSAEIAASHAFVPSLSADDFKAAFRHHPGGVTVITADAGSGPVALTATSVSSVSADPPLLVFSISSLSSSAPILNSADTIVVHFIDARNLDIAKLGSTSGIDRFADSSIWSRLPTGEPVFHEVAVWIRARVVTRLNAGGSKVIVAQGLQSSVSAETIDTFADIDELVYVNRTWHRLGNQSRIA